MLGSDVAVFRASPSMKLEDLPGLNESYSQSQLYLNRVAPDYLSAVRGPTDHVCVLAVGSYGRLEAHPEVSDFEWITVYDDSLVGNDEARQFQADLTGFLADVFGRNRLSINKTFGDICSISDLCTNVGGEADTNRTLTYRMLALAEGAVLYDNDAYEKIIAGLAKAYGGSHTAGHRLLSLATDVARYWRTLRIDYKFKVDEGGKHWAVRSLKLRSSRRMWFLASALHLVAFGPRIEYTSTTAFDLEAVKTFMREMGGNPVMRLLKSAEQLAADETIMSELLSTYDVVQQRLADPATRNHLDRLGGGKRFDDEIYASIRSKCADLHRMSAELILNLPLDARREIVEMFLL